VYSYEYNVVSHAGCLAAVFSFIHSSGKNVCRLWATKLLDVITSTRCNLASSQFSLRSDADIHSMSSRTVERRHDANVYT